MTGKTMEACKNGNVGVVGSSEAEFAVPRERARLGVGIRE